MKHNILRVLIILTCIVFIGGIMVFGSVVKNKGDIVVQKVGIRGTVKEILLGKDGIQMLVEGKKEEDTEYDKASVAVNRNTKVRKDGQSGKFTYSDIKVGDVVEVIFEGGVAESYPVQGMAKFVTILQPSGKLDTMDKIMNNSYVKQSIKELKELPKEYNHEKAIANGDIVFSLVKASGREKLDAFYESKGPKTGNDKVRVVTYTIEGDPILTSILRVEGTLILLEDFSRDEFSSKEAQTINVYKILELKKSKKDKGTQYTCIDIQGNEHLIGWDR